MAQPRGGEVHFLASAISRSDPPLDFFLWGFVKDGVYFPPILITLNNLKDRIRTATAKLDRPLMQNVWQEVEYCRDVCRAINGAHIEFS
jgi:hypothetical protein